MTKIEFPVTSVLRNRPYESGTLSGPEIRGTSKKKEKEIPKSLQSPAIHRIPSCSPHPRVQPKHPCPPRSQLLALPVLLTPRTPPLRRIGNTTAPSTSTSSSWTSARVRLHKMAGRKRRGQSSRRPSTPSSAPPTSLNRSRTTNLQRKRRTRTSSSSRVFRDLDGIAWDSG